MNIEKNEGGDISKDKNMNKKSKGLKDKAQKSVKDKGGRNGGNINKLENSNNKIDNNDKGDLFDIISLSSNEDKENIQSGNRSKKRLPNSTLTVNNGIATNPNPREQITKTSTTREQIGKNLTTNTINHRLIYDNSNESFDFDSAKNLENNKVRKLADIYNEEPKSFDK